MGNVFLVIQGLDTTACQIFDLGLPQRNGLGTRNEIIHWMNEWTHARIFDHKAIPPTHHPRPANLSSSPRDLDFPKPDLSSSKYPPILPSENPCKRGWSLNSLASNLPWTPYSRSPAMPVFTWTQWFLPASPQHSGAGAPFALSSP